MSSSNNSNSSPRLLPLRQAPPSSATTIRNSPGFSSNTLGLTTGWGIGISNSGSYLSSSHVRISVPVSTELSVATYEGIRSIIRKKKTREALALRRAAKKLEQEQERRFVAREAAANNVNDGDGKDGQGQTQKKAREKAKSKILGLKNELNKILMQRTELENNEQQWKEKIHDFEQRSLVEEEEEIKKLRQEHERELRQMEETMKAEQKNPAADETSRKGKRQVARGEMDESHKKRLKVGKYSTTGHTNDGIRDEAALVGKRKSRDTAIEKDSGLSGYGDAENEEVSLQSAEKAKELEEIQNEMKHLNKTKSQMIWLLKQVITAEKKQKLL